MRGVGYSPRRPCRQSIFVVPGIWEGRPARARRCQSVARSLFFSEQRQFKGSTHGFQAIEDAAFLLSAEDEEGGSTRGHFPRKQSRVCSAQRIRPCPCCGLPSCKSLLATQHSSGKMRFPDLKTRLLAALPHLSSISNPLTHYQKGYSHHKDVARRKQARTRLPPPPNDRKGSCHVVAAPR